MLLRKEKRHTITTDWDTQHYNDVLNVSARYFVGIDKITLKLKWKGKGTRVANTISKKQNKVGGITLSHFKTYYRATIIKTVWYWQRDRYIDQWNRIENTGGEPHKHAQLTFDKGGKSTQGKKENLLNKRCWSNLDIHGPKKKKKKSSK